MVAAFEACFMRPDPVASLTLFRISLKPWERASGKALTDEEFAAVANALGLARINLLHFGAVTLGAYLKGEEEDGAGKAESGASASST
jgi:hypothetical protein